MPIEIEPDNGGTAVNVRPGTNEAAVLGVLARHPGQAFRQAELAERADVDRGSVYKTVERLIEKGLAEWHTDGEHVHVAHDRRDAIYRRLRSFRETETFRRLFGDDAFAEQPAWPDEFDDLGREPLPNRDTAPETDEPDESGETNGPDGSTETDEPVGSFDVSELPDIDE